jgi:hypothetical protein
MHLPSHTRVFPALGGTYLRKAIKGLSLLVEGTLEMDPFSGSFGMWRTGMSLPITMPPRMPFGPSWWEGRTGSLRAPEWSPCRRHPLQSR